MSAQALIRADGVSVGLGGSPVLTAVDLSVHPGEVVALVGPNGAGKSTLLSLLSGDLAPETGTVQLLGRDLTGCRVAELARVRAVQLQESRVSFAFTCREVVAMGRAPWRRDVDAARDDEVVADALARARVNELASRHVPTLSGGEKARTAFARVLAQEPRLLLLDEPTAALDIAHQEAVLAEVRERAEQGAGVVVVLHDLTLAGAWADRVVLLADGRVRADGAPQQVLTPALLSEVYAHPVLVLHHPDSPGPVVLPGRPDPRGTHRPPPGHGRAPRADHPPTLMQEMS